MTDTIFFKETIREICTTGVTKEKLIKFIETFGYEENGAYIGLNVPKGFSITEVHETEKEDVIYTLEDENYVPAETTDLMGYVMNSENNSRFYLHIFNKEFGSFAKYITIRFGKQKETHNLIEEKENIKIYNVYQK